MCYSTLHCVILQYNVSYVYLYGVILRFTNCTIVALCCIILCIDCTTITLYVLYNVYIVLYYNILYYSILCYTKVTRRCLVQKRADMEQFKRLSNNILTHINISHIETNNTNTNTNNHNHNNNDNDNNNNNNNNNNNTKQFKRLSLNK